MHRIEVSLNSSQPDARGAGLVRDIHDLGIATVSGVRVVDVYWLDADLPSDTLDLIGRSLLADPVTQEYLCFTFSTDDGGRVRGWSPATSEGDLHAHTAYSKCMSGNDGVPQDVLRFQRDILGCKVLCLTEHVEYMSSPEFTHVLDAVEAEAGDDCVPVYGVEWAKNPAHHTNFFAIDREVYDKLRALMLVCDHLTPLYQRIRRELPAGSVVAIRHMHGMSSSEYGTAGARVTQTHDPETEWAMEAMQTRGNMMLSPLGNSPHFPTNFLNAGAKIGLIGGSDHSRGGGPNRFCLTGFWVPEVSPHAVLDSLRNRKTLALANGKVAIWATLNDKPIGEIVKAEGPVTIRAEVTCSTGISKVYLVRNGESLEPLEIGKPNTDVKLTDEDPPRGPNWYSVTVEAESAFTKPPILAHASPFFVEVT